MPYCLRLTVQRKNIREELKNRKFMKNRTIEKKNNKRLAMMIVGSSENNQWNNKQFGKKREKKETPTYNVRFTLRLYFVCDIRC